MNVGHMEEEGDHGGATLMVASKVECLDQPRTVCPQFRQSHNGKIFGILFHSKVRFDAIEIGSS
jgi:hypothetical protein